jgi:PKD repeat protein
MMKRLLQLLLLVMLLSGSIAALAYVGLPYMPMSLTALRLNSYLYSEPEILVADFEAEPTAGVRPLLVEFSNTSTGDYSLSKWDFGDGSTSSLDDPLHIYSAAGSYTVTLTISSTVDGVDSVTLSVAEPAAEDTLTRANYIRVYEPILANFEALPTSGVSPLRVTFSNTSTGDYDSCTWNFGDDVTSHTCEDVVHIYDNPGLYTVSLTASNVIDSNTRTKEAYIIVYEPVSADFSAEPRIGPLPLKVDFTNLSSGEYSSCSWHFGNGKSSTECDPSNTYIRSGYYTVTLTVSGLGGIDTVVKPKYVQVEDGQWYLPLVLFRHQPADVLFSPIDMQRSWPATAAGP